MGKEMSSEINRMADKIVQILKDSGLPPDRWRDVLRLAKQKIELLRQRENG